ncbi:MAG: bacterial Ig-like domain-containing protein [Bacteroidales bacterium]|nr:bacterial Ig-like domain-containing protein [Bacteroidales bacterium]
MKSFTKLLFTLLAAFSYTLNVMAAYNGTPDTPTQINGNYANYGLSADYDGYYVIRNAEELYGFAALVNGGTTSINGVLTANIVVNTNVLDGNGRLISGTYTTWTPIGNGDNSFKGTFDGLGHTISGLYVSNNSLWYVGLFGAASGTIKNVGVIDSYFYGSVYVGGIVGNGGTLTSCYAEAYVEGENYFIGGLVGGGGRINNCYSKGCVFGDERVGGISGNVTSVTNSYHIGQVFAIYSVGAISGTSTGTISNCYYEQSCAKDGQGTGQYTVQYGVGTTTTGSSLPDVDGKATAKTSSAFSRGEVTYLLNQGATEGDLAWYQNVNTYPYSDYPSLDASQKIVYVTSPCHSTYTNTKNKVKEHSYDAFGQCSYCHEYTPATLVTSENYSSLGLTEDYVGYYAIAQPGELYWFAELVNGGSNTANGVLLSNIVVNSNVINSDGELRSGSYHMWIPIGTSSKNYNGTFDGNGHYVSGLYFDNTISGNYPSGGVNVGLFGYASGTIKNVGLIGSYIKGNRYVGGICGYSSYKVINCYNTSTIIGTQSAMTGVGGICGNGGTQIQQCYNTGIITGYVYVGGIAGDIGGGGSKYVENCYNTGKIGDNSTARSYIGGICGHQGVANINNCYNYGTVSGTEKYIGAICGEADYISEITNCYYWGGHGSDGDKGQNGLGNGTHGSVTADVEGATTDISKTDLNGFSNGHVCFLLNGSTSEGDLVWFQTIGSDPNPVLNNTHGTVYLLGDNYSNTKPLSAPATLVTNSNYSELGLSLDYVGYYAIANSSQLYWFAQQVNDYGETYIKGVLVSNIVVNTNVLNGNGDLANGTFTDWTPIGTSSKNFKGIFDGNGHTISGLYFNNTTNADYPDGGKYVGLFGYLNSGTIKNVGLIDSYIKGYYYVGGISGYNGPATLTNCYNKGTISGYSNVGGICGYSLTNGTITNCYNAGLVSNFDNYAGGICGYGGTQTNCYNTGTVSGRYYVGGICGYSGIITNCYNTGTVGGTAYIGGICGNSGTVTESYCMAGKCSDVGEGTFASTFDFTSGRIAYLLNGSKSTGTLTWYQTIDSDSYPVLDNTHGIVYYGSACNIYQNTVVDCASIVPELVDDNNYEEFALSEDFIGYYAIRSTQDLYWFANKVNTGSSTIKGVLIADIVVNENVLKNNGTLNGDGSTFRLWTPIGTFTMRYKGKFDGNGHTISGLYFNNTTGSSYPDGGNYVGLFGYVDGAIIKNIGLIDSYIKGNSNIGAICGYAVNGGVTIFNCFNTGTISNSTSYSSSYVGGIIGNRGTLTNCYNTGAISGSSSYVGGISGEGGTLTNCYYLAGCATDGDGAVQNGIGTYQGSTVADKLGKTISTTTEQFASGEICLKLNNGETDEDVVWYQTLGTDALPTFNNTHKVVYITLPCISFTNNYTSVKEHTFEDGVCSVCGESQHTPILITNLNYSFYGLSSDYVGYYAISNVEHLYGFADMVNTGSTTIKGVLVADIVENEDVLTSAGELNGDGSNFRTWTPIGTSNNRYTGTFDGNGHTISGLYFNNTTDSFYPNGGKFVGLFGMAEGGTIKNVGLVDSYIKGYQYVGGISGCRGTQINCYNLGTILGLSSYVGGICGYLANITNCYNAGTISGSNSYVGGICGSGGTQTNCYYLSGSATSAGGGVSTTSEQFASGEIAYLLNDRKSEGNLVWYQTIGMDDLPVLVPTHKVVYATSPCHTEFSNTEGIVKEHTLDDFGHCSVCGAYQSLGTLVTTKNYVSLGLSANYIGYYAISNASELYGFAHEVNIGSTDINGVLVADIVVNEDVLTGAGELNGDGSNFRSWTPIGTSSKNYQGIFDGNGHTISGLYFNNTANANYPDGGNYVGLFGYAIGGTIKNVGLVDSYIKGDNFVGGICGYYGTQTNCYNMGTVSGSSNYVGGICGFYGTLTNCYNTGIISGGNNYVGGICGYGGTQTNCYNTGTISGSSSCVGGICGEDGTLTNCYNTGTILGGNYYVGGICGRNGTQTNCYYLAGCATDGNGTLQNGKGASSKGSTTADQQGETTPTTTEQFASGETCLRLNKGKMDEEVIWYQTLGTDALPTLNNTHKVVYVTSPCHSEYTNNPNYVKEHMFEDGVCSVCGESQETSDVPVLLTSDNAYLYGGYAGYYAIFNAEHLYWFANEVNSGSTTIKGILLADIVVNENVLTDEAKLNGDGSNFRTWTPIGTSSKNYAGTFDGNGHTISGLYFNNTTNANYPDGGKYIGLFGNVNGGTIKNVGLVDSYIKGYQYVGGISGYGGTLTNCYNMGTVSGSSNYVGGICGYYGTLTNCYNTGTVSCGGSYVGGICGVDGTQTNCYNTGTVTDSDNYGALVGGICGGGGTQTNCYNIGTISGGRLYVGSICGRDGTQTNCYYLAGSATDRSKTVQNGVGASSSGLTNDDVNGETISTTAEQFASGEIAYLLNDGSFTNTTWRQTLYSDASPVLDNNHNAVTGYATETDNVITVIGDFIIATNYEIAEGKTMNVPLGTSLTTVGDAVITNNGVLRANGTLAGNNLAGNGQFVKDLEEGELIINNLAESYEYKGSDYTIENGLTGVTLSAGTTIMLGKNFVVEMMPYNVSYANNRNVGTSASIIFTNPEDEDNVITGTFAIVPKNIEIVEIETENKEYDGATTAAISYALDGVVDGDDVKIVPTATFADKNVGEDIEVTYSFAKSGEDADNYTLSVETVDLKANITAKEISISEIVVEDKEYDGTTTATATFTMTGAIENEDVAVNYTATFDNKNAEENKTVSLAFELAGEDIANYALASSTATTTANITAKLITINEIATENKEYDGTTTAKVTYTETGVVENDDVTIEPTATFVDKNVGEDKTVTYSFAKSGEDADNYTLSAETVDLKANITAKSIAISNIVAENKPYDGTTTATVTYAATGVVENDDVTIEPTATFADKNVADDKAVTYSFAKSGEDADNYELSVETVDLKANITAKSITISEIAAENKEYDGTTTATVTYTANGTIENDDVTVESTATFADKNVGNDKVVTYSFAKSGEDAENYELSVETVDLKANITAKAITVSEIAAENKEYDGTTAAMVTYTVNGVVENDDVTIEPNATFADKNVGEDIVVTYSFAKSGDDADNYELSVETVDLKANITAKSITISEIAANDKVYDGTTTATATFTTTGAIENEDVAVNYTATFDNKNAGENKILSLTFELTGEDIANYALASETATATANITAKSISISEIVAENKEYDGATEATVTYTANGVVENDDVTIEPTAEFVDEKVGEDKAVTYSFAKSGEDADNYTLSVETVDLKANIAAKAITISEIVANNKEYDGTTAATATFTMTGAIENEDVDVNYTATFDDKNAGENKTVSLTFELTGEDIANYALASSTATATANITAKAIAISDITVKDKVYDGETTATLTFELDGILENDEVEVSYTANFADKNVGEDKAVTFNFAKSGADEANYELAVEATEPKAAITANTSVEVTITENSGTETYDGTEKTVTGYAVEINSELYKESDFAFNGTAEVKGTNVGEYEMNIVASDFENTNTNFTDVKFTVVDGKLTIEKSSETPNMPELMAETRLLNITDVALPEGWAWADETIVLEEGENSAVANYVGDDAGNYTVESVTITITRLPCLHDGEYTIVDAKEATCTADGYTGDHKCSICGAIFEQGSVIPAEGHKAGEPVVENYNAPTCKEAGSVDTVYYCTIDGDLISRETYVLEAKGHQPGEKVAENLVPATITSEGSVDSVTYCTVCGEELSREHFVLPVLDHEHIAGEPVVENYVAPTCTEAGAVDTVVYCTVNGEELSREHFVLPALGHTAGEPVIENYTAPTCTEAGTVDTVYYCTIDNEEISRETYVLEAKGHQPSEKVAKNYVAPTCLVAGSVDSVVTCTVCGEILSEEHFVLPALGHKPSEKVAINYVPATTTTEGSVDSVITCTVCGEVLYNEHFVLPILDHEHIAGEPVEENRVEPTCLVDGSADTVVYCTVNGEELSREHYILPALGHQPSEKVAKNYVAPTCLVAGSVDSIITCTICGEVLSEEHFVLPATGHIAGEPVIENYVAPTCTKTGTVDTVYYCTVDGDLISRETHVLPMLEHVPGEKVAENYVAPTFTAVGSVDSVVYCTIGGEELSRETFELPMLQKAVEKIEILSMPKTEYVVGEDIDITGAKISVTFNDGSVEEIDLTNEMLSGFDNTLVAEQDITVTYLTFTTTIHVTVNEKTAVSDIATDATSIYAYGHTIVVETASFIGKDIMVYDINGRIIAKVSASDERTEINVPRTGVYGVRIETVSATVMIR